MPTVAAPDEVQTLDTLVDNVVKRVKGAKAFKGTSATVSLKTAKMTLQVNPNTPGRQKFIEECVNFSQYLSNLNEFNARDITTIQNINQGWEKLCGPIATLLGANEGDVPRALFVAKKKKKVKVQIINEAVMLEGGGL